MASLAYTLVPARGELSEAIVRPGTGGSLLLYGPRGNSSRVLTQSSSDAGKLWFENCENNITADQLYLTLNAPSWSLFVYGQNDSAVIIVSNFDTQCMHTLPSSVRPWYYCILYTFRTHDSCHLNTSSFRWCLIPSLPPTVYFQALAVKASPSVHSHILSAKLECTS